MGTKIRKERIEDYIPTSVQVALGLKVDKSGAKQLSDENYTLAEKNKLAGLDSNHWKGTHVSLAALNTAHPTAIAGNYADVDAGASSDVARYIWDVSDSKWVIQSGTIAGETAASILTKYESNPDRNGFTDAEQTKVAAIDQSVSTTEKATWNGKQNALGFTPENDSNKSQTIETDKASTTKYGSIAAWITWLKNSFVSNLPAKATALVDGDLLLIGDSEDASKTKTRTFAQLKATLKTYFEGFFGIKPIITISGTYLLTDADNGRIFVLTANTTVTIPNALIANFEATIVTLTGATLTVSLGDSVTLLNNAGTTMAEKLSVTIKQTLTANQFLTVGNL